MRRSCQSLFKSKPQHRIPVSIQTCLVSFKGKRTASQGPSFSWEALTAPEGQVRWGLSLFPGVAEFLCPRP